MEQTATPIHLPSWVPCPVTVEAFFVSKGDVVTKNQSFLKYKYWEYRDDPTQEVIGEAIPDYLKRKVRVELIGNFEFPVAGTVTRLCIRKGQEIGYTGELLAEVLEACAHAVQFGGLCALCGISLEEEKSYSGYSYDDRAPISMSHDTAGLKVSLDEAERVETSSTKRLLTAKKLILVVDLDQTVIHATVDPTVGEWMKDVSNPNHAALKGVASFSLDEHPVMPPLYAGPPPPAIRSWYYVKLRPGLQEFLERVSDLYEMHIYTMATRTYAKNVAKIIDPTGKYFGDRILSRDESGSMTHKSLERLFPVDTSLVVVIDDRGDVWQWSDNLVKVVPYDFFVGIGDINSGFLPKLNSLVGPSKRRKSIDELEQKFVAEHALVDDPSAGDQETGQEAGKETNQETGPDSDQETGQETGNESGSIEPALAAPARPLAQLQEDLIKQHPEEKNLLSDDDTELVHLGRALSLVHDQFYRQYAGAEVPEIATIMPLMKKQVLRGLTLLFSGLLPLHRNPQTVDIVIWARSFGAQVVMEPYDHVTHVICKNPGTFKVRYSRAELAGVKIVNPDWLFACLTQWRRVEETNYEVVEETSVRLSKLEVQRYKEGLVRQMKPVVAVVPEPEVEVEEDNMDWDDLNKEVADFLSSDDDDDDESDEDDGDNGDDDGDGGRAAGGDVDGAEDGDTGGEGAKRSHESEGLEDSKRVKHAEAESDMDELERELMQGFDDMESEDE